MGEIQNLKEQLGRLLKPDTHVSPHKGLPTTHRELDEFLLWQGLPLGGMTLLRGHNGLGATSLWSGAASVQTRQQKWVAWLSPTPSLFPMTLQNQGIDLSYLWTVHSPFDAKTWFWVLSELIQSELFELIGCDLTDQNFTPRQWMKLQRLARTGQVATVFLQRKEFRMQKSPLFSLSIEFNKHHLKVHRAQHRPTPLLLPRRNLYANFMSQLTKESLSGNRRNLPEVQLAGAVSR